MSSMAQNPQFCQLQLLNLANSFTAFRFSQTHKIGNIGIIAKYVLPFSVSNICFVLVHAKLDISGCNRITLQGCRPHWLSSFLMKQLK